MLNKSFWKGRFQKLVEIHKQNEADYFPGKLSNTIVAISFLLGLFENVKSAKFRPTTNNAIIKEEDM